MSAEQRDLLDQMRGSTPRAVYVKQALFGDAEGRERYRRFMAGASLEQLKDPAPAQQVEPSAPIPVEPTPEPAAKEFLLLPPVGQPDAHGWHYRWEPRSATVGTLRIGRAGQEWRAVDLIGVELENLAGGQCKLSYADRSLVRVEESES